MRRSKRRKLCRERRRERREVNEKHGPSPLLALFYIWHRREEARREYEHLLALPGACAYMLAKVARGSGPHTGEMLDNNISTKEIKQS